MLLIGIMGGPGSGKTTVAGMFHDLGVPTLSYEPRKSLLWDTLKLTLFQGYSYALVELPHPHPLPTCLFERRLLVSTERDLQLQRIMESRSLSEKDSASLLQSPSSNEGSLYSHTIENSSSFQDTRAQVLVLHESTFTPLGSKRKWAVMGGILLVVLSAFFLK